MANDSALMYHLFSNVECSNVWIVPLHMKSLLAYFPTAPGEHVVLIFEGCYYYACEISLCTAVMM